jgi:hypothetical protein
MRIELQVGDNEYEEHMMCLSSFVHHQTDSI